MQVKSIAECSKGSILQYFQPLLSYHLSLRSVLSNFERLLKTGFTVILSLKVDFVFANSADPDEMPHPVAFHLGLHCLQNYPLHLGVCSLQMVNNWIMQFCVYTTFKCSYTYIYIFKASL